jgi:phage tail protein X
MMATKIYIATDNDRWDHLAYDFYGDASLVAPLMEANPGISPYRPYFEPGEKIRIPELPEEYQEQKESTVKAPWK